MASTKSGGTAKNLRDSNPKYLGIKLYAGETAKIGSVIVRQRGTRVLPGKNVGMGKDHTLFALAPGLISFGSKRVTRFDSRTSVKPIVHVVTSAAPSPSAAKPAKAPKSAVSAPASAEKKPSKATAKK